MQKQKDEFNINIPAETYFNELKLMEAQYGQEEDLYPWIYMLLQMNNTESNISIRTVANGSSAKNVLGRELIKGFSAFPDVVILDKAFTVVENEEDYKNKREIQSSRLYGCVETKGLSKKLLDITGKAEMVFGKFLIKPSKQARYGYYLIDERWVLSNTGNVQEPPTVEQIKNVLNHYESQGEYPLLYNNDLCYLLCQNNGKINDYGELLGELLWYGKVLYTNGKQWRFLTVDIMENNSKLTPKEFREKFYDCVNDSKKNLWCKKSLKQMFQ